MKRKQKISNLLAVATLMFFVCAILTVGAARWLKIDKTKTHMNELSMKVASLDRSSLMNWASGNEKDEWGNTFILEKNLVEVQFRSKGPDGIVGTKDDVFGESFPKMKPQYSSIVVVADPPNKSIISSVYDRYKSWRGNDKEE